MADKERTNRDEEAELGGDVPAEREASLLNFRTLIISAVGLIGMILLIHLLAGVLFAYFRPTETPGLPVPPTLSGAETLQLPGQQVAPAEDLLEIRATEQARLQGYGWIDREAGIVQIPIERAMEIVVERGLPVAEAGEIPRERIDARESGFPHPEKIPATTPEPQGTPLLEITVPPETMASPTAESDLLETTEASTPTRVEGGTPAASAPLTSISHGSDGEIDQSDLTDLVGYDQNLNNLLPLDTVMVDEAGRTIKLGDFFGDKPVVLVFAYYECPMLCTLVLNELTRTLSSIDLDIGDQFEVVTISIDPRETPELAYAKKIAYIQEYNRPGAEVGWHFLTGEEEAIQTLTQAAGFRYFYDEELDQYAHPAGVLVLTPKGRIARYLSGLDLPAKDLRLSVVEASAGKIGTVLDQFWLLCYAYDPVFGRYNLIIQNVLKIAGLSTVLILGLLVSFFIWKEKRRNSPDGVTS